MDQGRIGLSGQGLLGAQPQSLHPLLHSIAFHTPHPHIPITFRHSRSTQPHPHTPDLPLNHIHHTPLIHSYPDTPEPYPDTPHITSRHPSHPIISDFTQPYPYASSTQPQPYTPIDSPYTPDPLDPLKYIQTLLIH